MKITTCLFLSTAMVASVACGGGDGNDPVCIDESGAVSTYVVSELVVPDNAIEAAELKIDIDDNGEPDNKLGSILATIASIGSGFDVEQSVSDSINEGNLILLMAMQTTDFTTAQGAGLQVFIADTATPVPDPCSPVGCDPNDPNMPNCVCGNHLAGDGMFTLATTSPDDALIAGDLIGGKFTGGDGTVTLELNLTGDNAGVLRATLAKAHTEISGLSANGLMTGKIVGGITQDDIQSELLPAIAGFINQTVVEDCGPTPVAAPMTDCCNGTDLPNCDGYQFLQDYDLAPDPADGEITKEDLLANTTITSFLENDVDLNGDGEIEPTGTGDGISLGIGFSAVKGAFPVPGGALTNPDGSQYCSAP